MIVVPPRSENVCGTDRIDVEILGKADPSGQGRGKGNFVADAIFGDSPGSTSTLKSPQRKEAPVDFGVVDMNVRAEQEVDLLRQCGLLTEQMRDHQQAITMLNAQRRRVVRALRVLRVPYRKIAHAAGVSDQALYADLRKHPAEESK